MFTNFQKKFKKIKKMSTNISKKKKKYHTNISKNIIYNIL